MKITFLGGAGGVTGSKTLIEYKKSKFLVDYGLFQGSSKIRERNWKPLSYARTLDAVFLTHAHIDHSGLLPKLWKDGFRGKIYCTKETYSLCKILLMDSAKIHQEDAQFANRKKFSRHNPALPLYTESDVKETLSLFKPVQFDKEIKISKYLKVSFHWNGHILGSSFLSIFYKNQKDLEKTIVFSGDVGHERSILLKKPDLIKNADLLILESTYGNRQHSRAYAIDKLGKFLNMIISRKGVAVIPAFAVGRAQEILYLLQELMKHNKIPRTDVYLDSPLSKKANKIMKDYIHKGHIREEIASLESCFPPTLKEVESVPESKDISRQPGPMIVVSASGMIDGGRVVHHIKSRIENPLNGVLLVGYQPTGTKGRILLDGHKILRLHKNEYQVNASIFQIDSLSAHGDYLDLIEWVRKSKISPQLVILNHAESEASEHFKTQLKSKLHLKTTVAQNGESFDLDHLL